MYRFAIIIGVIIVVLLAEPVARVRFEPPKCRSVGLGVVTEVPLANNVRGKPKRGKVLGQEFCLDIGYWSICKKKQLKTSLVTYIELQSVGSVSVDHTML